MIEATTYLYEGATLVPLDDARKRPARRNYIEGAIELLIDGQPIITKDQWDLVDQLWAYLVNAMEDIAAGQDAEFGFPDTPIDMSFTLNRAKDLVTVKLSCRSMPKPRRATVPRAYLVRRICELARDALEKLYDLAPDTRFQGVLQQIRKVLDT